MNRPGTRGFPAATDARQYLKYSHLPLAIYGAGRAAEKLLEANFPWAGLSIDAVCDSDPAKCGQLFYGFEILSPESLVHNFPDANIILAISAVYEAEVCSTLRSLGVREDRIFAYNQVCDTASFPPAEFSVFPFLDLYKFAWRLADNASKELFRLRYRHWLLGDRPGNPRSRLLPPIPLPIMAGGQALPSSGQAILRYADASDLCCAVDRHGEDLGRRNILLEFENCDLLAARAFFALAHFRPEAAFLLREGAAANVTRFWSLARELAHAL